MVLVRLRGLRFCRSGYLLPYSDLTSGDSGTDRSGGVLEWLPGDTPSRSGSATAGLKSAPRVECQRSFLDARRSLVHNEPKR